MLANNVVGGPTFFFSVARLFDRLTRKKGVAVGILELLKFLKFESACSIEFISYHSAAYAPIFCKFSDQSQRIGEWCRFRYIESYNLATRQKNLACHIIAELFNAPLTCTTTNAGGAYPEMGEFMQ